MSPITAVLLVVIALLVVLAIYAERRAEQDAEALAPEPVVVPEPAACDLHLTRLIRGSYDDLPYRGRVPFEPVEWAS